MKKLTKKEVIQAMTTQQEIVNREHTFLSASWAKIWLYCTKATELSKLFPKIDDNEDYTIEGTTAHFLAELLLTKKIVKEQLPSEFFDLEMYYDKVMEIKGDGNLLVEVQVDMTDLLEVPTSLAPIYGRSDFVILAKDGGIDIGDLKFGKGVKINAYKNDQLMLYALGTLQFLDNMGLIDTNELEDNTRVTLHIIQPRLDDNYSFYNTTIKELKEFVIFVKQQLKLIEKGGDALTLYKGEHCQFCKGKSFCPLFQETTTIVIADTTTDLSVLDNEKIFDLYNRKADVMAFYRALDKYIKANIKLSENGEFGGYKIISKEGNREVVDEEALIKQFTEAGCPAAELKDASIVGMTKLDKIAKKYGIAKEDIQGIAKKQTETVVPVKDFRDALFMEEN